MLRTSNYTIYVDLPGNQNEMLLVHGYTGAYDKVSRKVATYVRSLEAHRPPKPLYGDWSPAPLLVGQPETPSDIAVEVLKRRGYLTELSPAAEEQRFEEIVGKLHARSTQQMPNYIFMPTYDCNLRCAYCFQDHMRTNPSFNHLLRVLQPAVADRIFGAMTKIEALHGHEGESAAHRNIGFFGGEPLLEVTRPIVQYIIELALQKGTAFIWAVTNATELHAYRDLLGTDRIKMIQVTLDGAPREHDKRRIYADGSGSYERIARNISMALECGVKVSVRLNLDRNNIGDIDAIAAEFYSRGWDKSPLFSAYTAPIHAQNGNVDRKSTFDTWELDQALDCMRADNPSLRIIGSPDDMVKASVRQIFEEPATRLPNLRESFCSAHHRMYIFDPFGDIYACWERTGDPSIRIGRVSEDGELTLNMAVNDLWRSRTVASNPICKRCRYALYCGGGCAVLAAGATGRYHSNFCDGFASRFRAAVAESYLDHKHGVGFAVEANRVCDQ